MRIVRRMLVDVRHAAVFPSALKGYGRYDWRLSRASLSKLGVDMPKAGVVRALVPENRRWIYWKRRACMTIIRACKGDRSLNRKRLRQTGVEVLDKGKKSVSSDHIDWT